MRYVGKRLRGREKCCDDCSRISLQTSFQIPKILTRWRLIRAALFLICQNAENLAFHEPAYTEECKCDSLYNKCLCKKMYWQWHQY